MAGVSAASFSVDRFIGRGCYSMVYKVTKISGIDQSSSYALKRFFIENDSAYQCVRRERDILERLAILDHQCTFLPIMYYSFVDNNVFAFIVREGCGCDMYDLIRHASKLSESDARFYMCEIICALEHVHSLDIVHLDIKPENILCSYDGHIFLSDFDRSYDITKAKSKPTLDDFTGTPLFMAPEIAKGEIITPKADIWSLAVLSAEMVSGPIRTNVKHTEDEFRLAREGRFTIKGMKGLSKPLQSFFTACFQRQHTKRPDVSEMKKLRFLKYVDWGKVHNGLLKPPYDPAEIKHRAAKEDRCSIASTDERLLAGAFSQKRPLNLHSRQAKKQAESMLPIRPDGDQVDVAQAASTVISNVSLTDLKRNFEFVHSRLTETGEKQITYAEDKGELIDSFSGIKINSYTDDDTSVKSKLLEEYNVDYRRQRNLSVGD